MLDEIIKSFAALFVVMDFIGNIPVYLCMAEGISVKKKKEIVNTAVYVAGLIILTFLIVGRHILDFFGIRISSFKIAGGIILLIIGIKFVLGLRLVTCKTKYEIAAVPLATPLIAGPGVLTTTIILVLEYGFTVTIIAAAAVLFVQWLALRESDVIHKVIGHQGSEVVSKVMGLIIAAFAVEYIIQGWQAIV